MLFGFLMLLACITGGMSAVTTTCSTISTTTTTNQNCTSNTTVTTNTVTPTPTLSQTTQLQCASEDDCIRKVCETDCVLYLAIVVFYGANPNATPQDVREKYGQPGEDMCNEMLNVCDLFGLIIAEFIARSVVIGVCIGS